MRVTTNPIKSCAAREAPPDPVAFRALALLKAWAPPFATPWARVSSGALPVGGRARLHSDTAFEERPTMNSLFERASAGDAHATRMVVDSLRPRLAKMAAYYARRTGEEADDLLQEAWLGLLEALPGLDVRIGSPEQYLIHQARWRLLDAVRRASTRRFAPLDDSAR